MRRGNRAAAVHAYDAVLARAPDLHEAHLFYDPATDRALTVTLTWRDRPDGTLLDDIDGVRAAPPAFLRVDVHANADGLAVRGCGEEVRRRW